MFCASKGAKTIRESGVSPVTAATSREPPAWSDSTEWQYWVIDVVKRHEKQMGYDVHPIGVTMQFPVVDQMRVNEPLFASNADWISPGYDDETFRDGQHPMAPGSPPSQCHHTMLIDGGFIKQGEKVRVGDGVADSTVSI
jgi:hypothetical protein